MTWADVPAKVSQYDGEGYADNSNGTTASQKLAIKWTFGRSTDYTQVAVTYRNDFEDELDYRLTAVINLRTSRAIRPEVLNGDVKKEL